MGLYTPFMDFVLGTHDADMRQAPASVTTPPPEPAEVDRAPVIGISGSSESSKSVIAAMSQIRSAGGVPVYIGGFEDRIRRDGSAQNAATHDLARIDGLMVLGNDGDIDPAKYGAAKDSHTKVETDLARAAYEETAIQQALDSGIPLLGICGGLQRINVLGGGTLHQHVPDIVGDNHHMQSDGNIAPFVPVQVVQLGDGSMLGDIAGHTKSVYTPTHQTLPDGVVMENSFHHQAIKDVRPDFQVNAISSDGIIEGIEPKLDSRYGKQFVLGVQWHPEFGASELGPKIANNFLGAARDYAKTKPQTAFMEPISNAYYDVHTNVPDSPPSPQLMTIDPAMIHTDPAAYQFRAGGDANGVTEAGRIKSDRWDPSLNGDPLLVHQRLNGEYFVVDGHHRLDLAKRTNAMGTGPGNLAVEVLREADGYTAQDCKIIAGYKNLQKDLSYRNASEATLVDGAHVFKEAQTVAHPKWLPSLKMDTSDMQVSYKLSQLSEASLDAVANGRVPAVLAAQVPGMLQDTAQQDETIRILGDRLAQENYNVSVSSDGMPVAQDGSFGVPHTLRPATALDIPQNSSMPSHVQRLMNQRSGFAAMVR